MKHKKLLCKNNCLSTHSLIIITSLKTTKILKSTVSHDLYKKAKLLQLHTGIFFKTIFLFGEFFYLICFLHMHTHLFYNNIQLVITNV